MELATELRVDVLGAQAHSAQVMIDGLVDGILVAPEKRFVRAGEALNVDLTSSHNGRVLVDALREGKVLASSSVEISDARATAQLNLPTDLHGGVQIRALQRSAEGALYTGLSLVHVDGGKVINVAITPEKPSYRPWRDRAAGDPGARRRGQPAAGRCRFDRGRRIRLWSLPGETGGLGELLRPRAAPRARSEPCALGEHQPFSLEPE